MKRRCLSLIIVICLVSVVVAGCAKNSASDTSPEYKFGTDCQYYNCTDGWYRITESEKGFYYFREGYLYFIDKTTMQQTILCGKPNCKHQQETEKRPATPISGQVSTMPFTITTGKFTP